MTEQQELPEDQDEKKKRAWLKPLLLIVAMLLVAGVSVGLTLFLTGPSTGGEAGGAGAGGEAAADMTPRANYMQLNPPFIVSFEEAQTRRQRFLQVELAIMARNQDTLDTLTEHMPRVRNNVIQALSEQTFSDIRTDAGRQEVTNMVRNVLQEIVDEYGDGGTVERVLFRNFVLQ